MQHPLMKALDGDRMTAREAAWATVAEAAERAQQTPGLSEEDELALIRLSDSCFGIARLPVPRRRSTERSRSAWESLRAG